MARKSSGSMRSRAAARGAARAARNSSSGGSGRSSSSSSRSVSTQTMRDRAAARGAARQAAAAAAASRVSSARANMERRKQERLARIGSSNTTVLTRAEAMARVAITQSDPQMEERFGTFLDTFQQFDMMSDTERNAFYRSLEEEAYALVDEPFDYAEEQIKVKLQMQIDSLNTQFDQFSKEQKAALERAVRDLDFETADNLSKGIDNLHSRGAMNSGLFAQLADSLMETRDTQAGDARDITDLNIKKAQIARDIDVKDAQFAADDLLYDVGQDRQAERSKMLDSLMSDLVEQDFLLQQKSASAIERYDASQKTASDTKTTQVQTSPRNVVMPDNLKRDTNRIPTAKPTTPKIPTTSPSTARLVNAVAQRKAARLARSVYSR